MGEKLSLQEQFMAEQPRGLVPGMPCYINWLEAKLKEKDERIAELEDFAIWMTGCGYDFCQHPYFVKMRDKLLKGE